MNGLLRWGAVLGLGLLLASCGGGSADPAAHSSATVPTAPPTTRVEDAYAVPAVIDAAYLNRVFLALDHVDGDAARLIFAAKALTPAATERLRAIYDDDEFRAQTEVWLQTIGSGLDKAQPNPGDRKTTVVRVISSKAGCVFAEVERDYSAVARSGAGAVGSYIALAPLEPGRDRNNHNPTPWLIDFAGRRSTGEQPSDPCA